MKRRLSIACAFIGNSKFVLLGKSFVTAIICLSSCYLDEPSSGLDPVNRRLLWSWIRSMRESRTILLSTHFMEEADALSDQIMILSHGKVVANDTNTELKRIYGTGYKLILNTSTDENNDQIFEVINKILLNSKIESETNDQLIIQTNEQASNLFVQVFNELDSLKKNNLVLDYGLTNTTLGSECVLRFYEKVSFASFRGSLSSHSC